MLIKILCVREIHATFTFVMDQLVEDIAHEYLMADKLIVI
jgi:hypothetical protein